MEHFETLKIKSYLVEHNLPSIEKPHELELKQLPSHLLHACLDGGQKLHVIIPLICLKNRDVNLWNF